MLQCLINLLFILKEYYMVSTKNFLLLFSPHIFFLINYLLSYLYIVYLRNDLIIESPIMIQIPFFTSIVISFYALFIVRHSRTIHQKFIGFYKNAINTESFSFYVILQCIMIFNHSIGITNGTLGIITLILLYIPAYYMIPSLFFITLISSIIIESTSLTIFMIMPIGCGIAQALHIHSGLTAATIICGALYGYHLKFYKHIKNLTKKNNEFEFSALLMILFILLASGLYILLLPYTYQTLNQGIYELLKKSYKWQKIIPILPYFMILIARYNKFDLISSLLMAITSNCIYSILFQSTSILDTTRILLNGYAHDSIIHSMILFYCIMNGLTSTIEYAKIADYLSNLLKSKKINNKFLLNIYIIIIFCCINLIIISNNQYKKLIKKNIKRKLFCNSILYTSFLLRNIIVSIIPYSTIMIITPYIMNTTYKNIIIHIIPHIIIILIPIFAMLNLDSKLMIKIKTKK